LRLRALDCPPDPPDSASIDFALGRIYQTAISHTYNNLIKLDASGMPIHEPAKWVTDPELLKMRAATEYRSRNCSFLK
jgi:hypothetical protein